MVGRSIPGRTRSPDVSKAIKRFSKTQTDRTKRLQPQDEGWVYDARIQSKLNHKSERKRTREAGAKMGGEYGPPIAVVKVKVAIAAIVVPTILYVNASRR